jgi:hypothetical protein
MKIQSKSLLAKLLATENITVEVRADLPTAAFDPTSRTMYLPKWKDMPIGMQDLLIGHEVGHAFETPAEGWHDAICEDKTLKGFLNIIEDARIERKIKSRYPGLVKSFYAGYRELYSRDFFGVKDVDTNKLPLIDRINLHFKVGAFLNVRFSTTEQTFVNRCANTETWEEVEALARELHGKAQDDAEENIKQLSEEFEIAEQENDDSEASFEGDMSDWESEDSDDTEEEGSATGNAGDETDEDSETESSGSGDSDEDDSDDGEEKPDAPEAVQDFVDGGGVGSITDSSFREKEKELIDDSFSNTIKYITIPTKIDLDKIITPAKTVYDWSKIEVKEQSDPKAYGEIAYREFLSKNSSTVNQMVSAFEMKRKAQLYVKAKTAKTGDLDEDRLWSYKTSDNLFKQITNIPEGKNHGFILYLDMSGSMFRNMPGTIDQLLNLTMFARKANIPFEVYGFTSGRDSWHGERTMPPQDAKDGDYVLNDVQMIKLLDSTFSKPQIEEAYKYLLVWKQSFVARLTNTRPYVYAHDNPALSMNGTPLNATIVVAIEIAKRFRKSSNVEILNTVILTDGEATDFSEYYEGTADNYEKEFKMMPRSLKYNGEVPCFKYGSSVYEFLKGHCAHRNVELTASLLEMYKDITGSRVINYHLVDKWTKRNLEECIDYATVGNPAFGYSEWEDLWAAQKGSGLVEIKDKNGFDVRYIMNGASLNIKDEDLTVKSNKKGDLLRGFRKFAGSKSQQRVFVQKFIPEIA